MTLNARRTLVSYSDSNFCSSITFIVTPEGPMSIYLGYFIFIILTPRGFMCLILRYGNFKALQGLAIQTKDKEILRIFFGH